MKIVKSEMPDTLFCNLKYGDVFAAYGDYYMKIDNDKNPNNAVDLSDGSTLYFNETQTVCLIDCELVIK